VKGRDVVVWGLEIGVLGIPFEGFGRVCMRFLWLDRRYI